MKRSTSRLATVLTLAVLCSAAVTTASSGALSAGEPECARWDLNGEWKLVQTNETSPIFTLQLTPTGLQGRATYWYVHEDQCVIVFCGDDYYRVDGSVDGTVEKDDFEIVAYWNNGTTGVYTGKIGQQGRIQGSTYDRQHPQVMAQWYSDRTAKCLDGTAGTGERIGTTSSALGTPGPTTVRPAARVRLPGGSSPSTLTKCEAAKLARARNSPAAPGLEKQCAAEQASGVSNVATAADPVRAIPSRESPVITKVDKFGSGGAYGTALLAMQPESTIVVRVRYKKAFGYKGDTGAFGYVGPTSCDAFSISVAPSAGSARVRDPYRISSDSRMAVAGDYYVCSYVVSYLPLDQAMTVSVSMSDANVSGAWRDGADAQPPDGTQRTILDATRIATLNASQSRARLSYEMVYAPVAAR